METSRTVLVDPDGVAVHVVTNTPIDWAQFGPNPLFVTGKYDDCLKELVVEDAGAV